MDKRENLISHRDHGENLENTERSIEIATQPPDESGFVLRGLCGSVLSVFTEVSLVLLDEDGSQ